jgi:hypothetical protein
MSKLKYGMAAVGAIAVSVGVAGLSLPQALAAEHVMDQQSWAAQRATYEYGLLKQECDTLHYSQPQAYEACLEKAKSTRENLLTQGQGSQQAGQGSQGFGSQQSGQQQGPIEKVTSVVKEKLADWGLASPPQGQGGQPSSGQQGQGQGFGQGQQGQGQGFGQGQQQGQSFGQGSNPLQRGFDAGQGMQGQASAQQSFGAATGQTQGQGQQFPSQQGQSGQGSFQGGNYGQQPQGQSWQQGGGQQFQSGGMHGQGTGTAEVRDYPTPGAEEEHMDSVAYYQELARRQYATLKQECDALKNNPAVYDQCQNHAKSVRDQITGMAEQNQRGG